MPRPEDEFVGGEPALPPVDSLTGMDGLFAKTNIVVLILFSFCCSGIAFILGIVGLLTCTDPRAKQNALISTIIGGISTALGVISQITLRGH